MLISRDAALPLEEALVVSMNIVLYIINTRNRKVILLTISKGEKYMTVCHSYPSK